MVAGRIVRYIIEVGSFQRNVQKDYPIVLHIHLPLHPLISVQVFHQHILDIYLAFTASELSRDINSGHHIAHVGIPAKRRSQTSILRILQIVAYVDIEFPGNIADAGEYYALSGFAISAFNLYLEILRICAVGFFAFVFAPIGFVYLFILRFLTDLWLLIAFTCHPEPSQLEISESAYTACRKSQGYNYNDHDNACIILFGWAHAVHAAVIVPVLRWHARWWRRLLPLSVLRQYALLWHALLRHTLLPLHILLRHPLRRHSLRGLLPLTVIVVHIAPHFNKTLQPRCFRTR